MVGESGQTSGEPVAARRRGLRTFVWIVCGACLAVGLFFGVRYLLFLQSHERTDDAFLAGHIVQISSRMDGHVQKVYVEDNEAVKKGQLLVELDTRELQDALAQARAELDLERARSEAAKRQVELTRGSAAAGLQEAEAAERVSEAARDSAAAEVKAEKSAVEEAGAGEKAARSRVAEAQAMLEAAEAAAKRDADELHRIRKLFASNSVSQQELDDAVAKAEASAAEERAAQHAVSSAASERDASVQAVAAARDKLELAEARAGEAKGKVAQAQAAVAQARAGLLEVPLQEAQAQTASAGVKRAQAEVEAAELRLSFGKIYAPADGRVARRSVEPGMEVQSAQPLLALVRGEIWVVANFKETQLTDMKVGQPVELDVDAYPDVAFHGHIESFQPGTGAAFSLLPPENATGNYIKVVQRVPVKIVFDAPPDPSRYFLAPGMSVVPTVNVDAAVPRRGGAGGGSSTAVHTPAR